MSDRRNISPGEKASSSRFKDPRVVRVSRALGGKDRHSKVCTVRGLRDRRVRLSVPTAIQLYSLQERLGFNQPSKVVDWLLNAAKSEIDELPPLQIPQGMFNSCTQDNNLDDQPMLNSREATTTNTNTNTYVRLSPSSNLTLCQNPTPPQHDEYWHSFGFLPFQASTVPSGSHQVLLYHHHQTAAATAGVMSTHSSQEYI